MCKALTFDMGTILRTFFVVALATVPVFIVIYAIGHFLGPVTPGCVVRHDRPQADDLRLLPAVGGADGRCWLLRLLLLLGGSLTRWTFLAFIVGIFSLPPPRPRAATA